MSVITAADIWFLYLELHGSSLLVFKCDKLHAGCISNCDSNRWWKEGMELEKVKKQVL